MIDNIFYNILRQHEGPAVSETLPDSMERKKPQTSISANSYLWLFAFPKKTAMIHTKHPSTTTLFTNHPYNHKSSDPVVSFIEKRFKKICLVNQGTGKIIPLSFQLCIFASLHYLRFPPALSFDELRDFRMASYLIIA